MIYLCYVLFILGLLSDGAAMFFIGDSTGETLSDFGNAFMLITAVTLLLRSSRKGGQLVR